MGKPAGLTARVIAALKPRVTAYEVRDAAVSGGYVVVFPSGAVSYVLCYRFAGKKVKHTVGKFDPTARGGLAGARAAALKALADLAQARTTTSEALLDPASAKRAARPAKARATLAGC